MSERVTVDKADLQQLFDLAVNSLDFGSGWWDDEDVERARRIAVAIGADPSNATPSNFAHKYQHDFQDLPSGIDQCARCWKPRAWKAHETVDQP